MYKRCAKQILAPAAAGLFLLLSGCVGYQLGSMLPSDIQTVYVPMVENSTMEPNIEAEITRAIVDEVQRDGSLDVSNDPAVADSILQVEIRSFTLNPIAFNEDRVSETDEYRLQIRAKAALIRRSTGEIIAESVDLTGREEFLFTSDLTTAKRQNLDEAAEDLARDIVQMMVEVW